MPTRFIDFQHQAFGSPEFGPARTPESKERAITEGHAAFKGATWDVDNDAVQLGASSNGESAGEGKKAAAADYYGQCEVEIVLRTPPSEHQFRIGDEII